MPRVSAIAKQRNAIHSIFTQNSNLVVTGLVFNSVKMALDTLCDDSDSESVESQSESESGVNFFDGGLGLSFDNLGVLIEHLHQLYTRRYGVPRTRIPKSTH
jgi:hypothetical protein